jgi:carbonic anhydrase/acetyltransferase-like protein (isoleucine patch superfamily)
VGDVFIGDRVLIGHGAVLNGRHIGDHVLVGMNATLLHDSEIHDFCIIGAGCVVGQGMRVPERSFIAGVPGTVRGPLSEQQVWWVKEGYKEYIKLRDQYRAEGLSS